MGLSESPAQSIRVDSMGLALERILACKVLAGTFSERKVLVRIWVHTLVLGSSLL
jgi:hypothetical protein